MTAALPQPSGEGSDWTVETLRQFTIEALAMRDRAEVERGISRDRAEAERDRRYQERFEANAEAVKSAFLAQSTAMQAALTSAERAAATLAIATDQRLAAMNEFRGAVQDVMAGAMPRAEAESRINNVLDKLADANQRADESQRQFAAVLAALDSRIVGAEQRDQGGTDTQGLYLKLGAMVIATIGVIVSIYLATR